MPPLPPLPPAVKNPLTSIAVAPVTVEVLAPPIAPPPPPNRLLVPLGGAPLPPLTLPLLRVLNNVDDPLTLPSPPVCPLPGFPAIVTLSYTTVAIFDVKL